MIWAYNLLEPSEWDRPQKQGCSWYDPEFTTEMPPFALTTEWLAYECDLPPVSFLDSTYECGKQRSLGLLGTNRQIRYKAEQMFWSETTFCFGDVWVFCARTDNVPNVWPKVHRFSFMTFHKDEGMRICSNGGEMAQILRQMPAPELLEVQSSFLEHRMVDLMSLPAFKTRKVRECKQSNLAPWEDRDLKLWMALGRDSQVPRCYGVVHKQLEFLTMSGINFPDEQKACQVCLPAWNDIRHRAYMMSWETPVRDNWEERLSQRLNRMDVSQTAEEAFKMPVKLRPERGYLEAEVWGSPTRPISEHRSMYFRQLRDQRNSPVVPRKHPLIFFTSEEDDYSPRGKSARSQRCRQQRIGVDDEAKAQRRAEKKNKEAKHEAAWKKSECKKRNKGNKEGVGAKTGGERGSEQAEWQVMNTQWKRPGARTDNVVLRK